MNDLEQNKNYKVYWEKKKRNDIVLGNEINVNVVKYKKSRKFYKLTQPKMDLEKKRFIGKNTKYIINMIVLL